MKSVLTVLAGSSILVFASAATAQAATKPPRKETRTAQLEEVVVTAQKRSERAQDIPLAIEVMTPKALSQAGVSNLQELNFVSPSVQGIAAKDFIPPAIRGISSFAYSIGVQAQTGVVLDDVPQPTYSTLANELIDVERVEVLPGPQSTLSGRNSAGGLINIVTRKPSNTFTGEFKAEQTNDRQTRLALWLSGPLSDTLAASISTYKDKWEGPITNVGESDRRLGGFDRRGVRSKLQWQPTDAFTATLTGFYTKGDYLQPAQIGGQPYVAAAPGVGTILVPGSTLATLYPDVTVHNYNTDTQSSTHGTVSTKNEGVTLRLDYDTAIGTISSISNYSKSQQPHTDLLFAFDFPANLDFANSNTWVDYTSQEFRLTSPSGLQKWKYLVGLIYTNTKNKDRYEREFAADHHIAYAYIRNLAAYGQATYEFIPATYLTVGLRYEQDDPGYKYQFTDNSAPTSKASDNDNFITGKVSLQHDFGEDIRGYVTWSSGQTGKVYDVNDSQGARMGDLKTLPSQKVKNIEFGVKSQWFDRRLTFNIAVFDAKYRNYQLQSIDLSNAQVLPIFKLYAIGKVEDKGVEIDTSFAATPNLRLSLNATYLDAKIVSFPNAQCYIGQTTAQGCINGVQPNVGGPLPGTSKYRMVASANYTLPMPSLPFDANFGVNYRYQTKTTFSELQDPSLHQYSYGILNLSAGIHSNSDGHGDYTVEVFVNNVLDQHYYARLSQYPLMTGFALEASYARDYARYAGVRVSTMF